jgi:hypothetical protein
MGTPVVMTLNVAEREMHLNGVVVYSDPGHGVGVRFRDLAAEDRDFLIAQLGLA